MEIYIFQSFMTKAKPMTGKANTLTTHMTIKNKRWEELSSSWLLTPPSLS